MSLWKKFKAFYNASPENRIGFYNFLAFLVIPILGMTILYVLVRIFWISA
ncbi:Sugar ABC transporter permease [Legionella anisa]